MHGYVSRHEGDRMPLEYENDRARYGYNPPATSPCPSPPPVPPRPVFGTCGCGRPVRYIVPGGDGTEDACNKHSRCPDPTIQRASAWRVPTYETPFGSALDTSLGGVTILLYRGSHGWKTMDGTNSFVRLAHQIYEKDLVGLLSDRTIKEICAVDLNCGKWKTIFALTDADVTHP